MTRNPATSAIRVAILVVWGLFCLFPVAWLLITSIKNPDAVMGGPYYLPFIDFTPTPEAWQFIFMERSDSVLWPLFNTFAIGLVATALSIMSAILFLYAISRLGRPMPGLMVAMLASRIVPPAVLVFPLYVVLQHVGLQESRMGLALVYAAINLPVALWLLLPVLGTRATDQEEAARLDGANHIMILHQVLLPMAKPGVLSVGLFVFLLCWNEYLLAASLNSGSSGTLSPWMAELFSIKEAQVGGDAEEGPRFAAAAVLLILPLLFLTTKVMRALQRPNAP